MAYIDPTPFDRMLAPLCRRYLLVLFQSLRFRVDEEDEGLSDRQLLWALGALADGQQELAGAWMGPESCESAWRDVFDALQKRGVEQIRFVVSANSHGFQSALQRRYPKATVAAAAREASALSALPCKHRSALLASHKVADELQRLTSRAVTRHGPFANTGDAVSYIAEALRRAEQRLGDVSVRQAAEQLARGVRRRVSRRSGPTPLSAH
jgi:hypothetical protein